MKTEETEIGLTEQAPEVSSSWFFVAKLPDASDLLAKQL